MTIDDMIYLLNANEFSEYIAWSLSYGAKQAFVDLEQDPLEMITGEKLLLLQPIQKLFSSVFTLNGVNYDAVHCHRKHCEGHVKSSAAKPCSTPSPAVIDLSAFLQDSQILIPTLNGWLLGYPVVYMFGKDHISDAVYNLSTRSLHIFKVLVTRNGRVCNSNTWQPEELMSFTVPSELSMGGRNEPWAEDFWIRMQAKWGRCKLAWQSMHLEVSECCPQAMVL